MIWILFLGFVGALLALDLFVLNADPHVVHAREAFRWTAVYVALALGFTAIVYLGYEHGWLGLGSAVGLPQAGSEAALQYLSGYLVELSLSMDNVFVIALIFGGFGIAPRYQHRVLFWGILGALVFRGAMILVGAALLERFEWVTYVFGAVLLYSAYRMWSSGGGEVDPEDNAIVRAVGRVIPVSREHHDDRFFLRRDGVLTATPAFVALLVVEGTDVVFAFDSIPAIFAITRDPFLVFSSNIFAILGLRSLYFVLASMMDRFHLLKYALVVVLAFVGVKILLVHHVHVPATVSLGVILVVLGLGIWLSLRQNPPAANGPASTPGEAVPERAEPATADAAPGQPPQSTP